MARLPASTSQIGLSLLLLAGVSACRPAVGPSHGETAASPPSDSARSSGPEPEPADAEQRALHARFADQAALSSERGEASYYSDALAGRSTASGEPYQPGHYTAAHRKLPFGTTLRVKRADDGRTVYVRVNDRGPFGKRRRIIDLSRSAAEALGMVRQGVAEVSIEVVERSDARASR
jgi:rare lipoprotein A